MMTVAPVVPQVPNKIQQGTVVFLNICSVIRIAKVGNHESPGPETTIQWRMASRKNWFRYNIKHLNVFFLHEGLVDHSTYWYISPFFISLFHLFLQLVKAFRHFLALQIPLFIPLNALLAEQIAFGTHHVSN